MKDSETDPALSEAIAGFGERLRAARIAAGYGQQADFARALNISVYRYNHWEQGRHPPGPHYLGLMKRKFGIGADWILSGDYGAVSGRILEALLRLTRLQDRGKAVETSDAAATKQKVRRQERLARMEERMRQLDAERDRLQQLLAEARPKRVIPPGEN